MDVARIAGTWWSGLEEVTDDLDAIHEGMWAVVITFEGDVTAVRFRERSADPPVPMPAWRPLQGEWTTSLGHAAYVAGVEEIRERIAAGTVYQVNLTRVMSHPWGSGDFLPALAPVLERGNPAPYASCVHVPSAGLDVVCASPEAYLVRDGDVVTSRPIKGTAPTAAEMLAKDYAENVMITDLVRNDLGHVSRPGSVEVDHLCRLEQHPGLVHLVSDVTGRLRPGTTWAEVLEATFPPGSVTGAPKSTALGTIHDLESVRRGPYCGGVGWIDADTGRAELAVGIRTFWVDEDGGRARIHFGTGAGITWASDPEGEWRETELKAARLVGLASGAAQDDKVGAGD